MTPCFTDLFSESPSRTANQNATTAKSAPAEASRHAPQRSPGRNLDAMGDEYATMVRMFRGNSNPG